MQTKFYIRIGDQVVNADNVVSFEISGSDIVRIWYVGSATPLAIEPAIPAEALLAVLETREWLL